MKSSRRTFLQTMAASATAAVAAEAAQARTSPANPATDLARPRIHAGSDAAPKLRTAYSWWSLIGLPRGGPEWSMEEKFRRVKEAGFEGIEMWVEPKDETEVRRLLDETGLFLGTGGHPNSLDDFKKFLTQVKRLHAEYIFVHPGNAFMSDDDAVKLVSDGYKVAYDMGVPMTLETHRGTVTENPYRAIRLAERVPQLRLTGDLSHYGVDGEMGGAPAADLIHRLSPLLDRIETMQTRITNGEQVQVDVGAGGGKLARNWVALWAEGLRRWRSRAQSGDWFPFATELGPPPYSILDLEGKEISDRWEQSLVMKRLIAEAWEQSEKPPTAKS
ncbi:MAG: sugar phosphate isomerase/epimerase family protein [Terriglobia bacterium]